MFLVQSWGNHVDVSQAALYYFAMLGCLALFCWIGNGLTEEVRIITAFTYITKMHIISKRDIYTILSTTTIQCKFL
jgi:hypothetical protein